MKLEGLDGYEKAKNDVDGIGVLTLIQSVCYKQDNSKHGVLEIVTEHRALATCFQHQNETEVDYSERFQGLIASLEASGEQPGHSYVVTQLVCEEQGLD